MITGWGHIADMIARMKANNDLLSKRRSSNNKGFKIFKGQHKRKVRDFANLSPMEIEEIRRNYEAREWRYRIRNAIILLISIVLGIFALYLLGKVLFSD